MPLLQAIVLGIIQGLTEFLPISSSAHLIVIPKLLGWPEQGLAFDIALHVGTLAAVILYFFRDWLQIIAQGFGARVVVGDSGLQRNRGLLWLLMLATVPAGLAGLLFQKKIEGVVRDNLYVIGTMAIVVGILMWLAENAGRKQKDLGHVSTGDALFIGIAQALALIPGVSRSGITMSAGLFRNLERETAARFSFLLLTPTVAGIALKKFYDLFKHEGGIPHEMQVPMLVGMVVSAITGCIVIRFFLEFLKTRTFGAFVAYRIVFGIIVIALAFFRFGGG
jgi:undecaprenyl-diphosphatase